MQDVENDRPSRTHSATWKLENNDTVCVNATSRVNNKLNYCCNSRSYCMQENDWLKQLQVTNFYVPHFHHGHSLEVYKLSTLVCEWCPPISPNPISPNPYMLGLGIGLRLGLAIGLGIGLGSGVGLGIWLGMGLGSGTQGSIIFANIMWLGELGLGEMGQNQHFSHASSVVSIISL